MILKNHTSAPVRKERLSPTNKARSEASQNKSVQKSGMTEKVVSFREVDSCKNRPKPRLGSVKLIRKKLRKEQILIESRPSIAETGLTKREK